MITPIDIQQVGFGVGFRGYDRKEVDNFLDALTGDYEVLFRENQQLKELASGLEIQVAELKKKETTLSRTLMSAQQIVDDVKENAQKDADLIIKEAEMNAEALNKKAEDDRSQLRFAIQGLHKDKAILLEKFRAMLRTFEVTLELESEQEPVAEVQNGH